MDGIPLVVQINRRVNVGANVLSTLGLKRERDKQGAVGVPSDIDAALTTLEDVVARLHQLHSTNPFSATYNR